MTLSLLYRQRLVFLGMVGCQRQKIILGKTKKHYSTQYNDKQKENVQKYLKKEIDLLGYKFQKLQTERE